LLLTYFSRRMCGTGSRLLQRLEAGIDHVRVAAQVGDVAGSASGRELGQELLHVALAHVVVRAEPGAGSSREKQGTKRK
jgi:hypothetical protein